MDQTMTSQPTSMNSVTSLRGALTKWQQAGRTRELVNDPSLLGRMIRLANDFAIFAHRHQAPPASANNGGPWTTWLMLGGRGAGKTRLGAEWVRAAVHGTRPYADRDCLHVALVGVTEHD